MAFPNSFDRPLNFPERAFFWVHIFLGALGFVAAGYHLF